MKIIHTLSEMNAEILKHKPHKQIGFVPTMGALHRGHISLLEASQAQNQLTVVSIFVNPTQFNNSSDLQKYPRTPEKDLEMLRKSGCDIVFMPNENEMYPQPDNRIFDLQNLDKVMEGKHRPGHFNGVAQIVTKLFEAVPAHSAYFGLKDFQQLAVIKQLVEMLKIPIQIVACPIIRENNGLAMSSRNELLTFEQRAQAGIIFQTLTQIKQFWGKKTISQLEDWAIQTINANKLFNVEYFEIVNSRTLEKADFEQIDDGITACTAVFASQVRLIDNVQILN